MKRPILLISAIVVLAIACVATWQLHLSPIAREAAELASFDHRDGKKEADADLERGIVKWKIAGRVSDYEARAALLKATLKTDLDWFGGCEGSDGRSRYEVEYNSKVRQYLVSLYGEALVLSVLGEAPKQAAKLQG